MHDIRPIGLIHDIDGDLLAFRNPNQLTGDFAIESSRLHDLPGCDLELAGVNAYRVVRRRLRLREEGKSAVEGKSSCERTGAAGQEVSSFHEFKSKLKALRTWPQAEILKLRRTGCRHPLAMKTGRGQVRAFRDFLRSCRSKLHCLFLRAKRGGMRCRSGSMPGRLRT